MDVPVNFECLLSQAATILRDQDGGAMALSDPVVVKDWRRSLVLRCKVESSRAGITSVILKQIREEPERGFSDWASLSYLAGLAKAGGLVPRFLGGDPVNRFFLMEDLGEGISLEEILRGGDRPRLLAALRDLAVQMARLHVATLDGEDSFKSVRSRFPDGDALGRAKEAESWVRGRDKILAWFEALGCRPPVGFGDSLAFIADCYVEAEGFLAFTHGDPAPSNNHFNDGGARLLDFEYGGFRHALYDITAWNVLCPLPRDLVGEMRRCFRDELARSFPAARDELRFAEAWACLCAYRAWAILTWIPPDVIHTNRPWATNWGMREAIFVALSRMEECAAGISELVPSGEGAGMLLKALRQHWSAFGDVEDLLPRWSASGPRLPA